MAPKTKFTKEQIIEAAFDIARSEGIDSITIRKVADILGSSIAPIYVNFKDVDELKREVFRRIIELSHRILIEQDTGNPFHDIGAASLRFAKEYSVLFRDLIMKQNDYMQDYDQDMGNDLVELMKHDADLKGFTREELMEILLKMRIFQTGLSVMTANGLLPAHFNDEAGVAILNSAAEDVIAAARLRKK